MSTQHEHARAVRVESRRQGFDACGIAAATPADPEDRLGAWLARGFAADMKWMARTKTTRQDVTKKVPGARSVVVVAKNYFAERPEAPAGAGRVARYAWGRDYHRVLRKPLRRLAEFIRGLEPGVETYCSIDSGPVLERTWAERAGLASIGKNSLALRRDMGSWFFLATIITSAELAPDEPAADICGTCTLCLDACPTGAIVEPRVVDSRRCISYQTIENRGEVPEDIQPLHGDWVFGCDICQEVCPWNRFATETGERDFLPRGNHANPDPHWLAKLDEAEFNREFEGTPVRRAKHSGMVRNARIAAANTQRA
ncbi:MAG: tRNA epoxyqueuosine(34) reductase QueG [Candidatus Hydrogenedentota bacterium]